MTKPVNTKTTGLLASLRDDIERFLDALFGELDRLRLGQIITLAAAPTPAPTRAAPAPAPPSAPAVKPSPTLASPPRAPVSSRQKPRRNLNVQQISSCG
jgi:hypothetical protein